MPPLPKFHSAMGKWPAAILLSLGCSIGALLLQMLLRTFTGGVAPLATFYPAVAIAALAAGARGGGLTMLWSVLIAWYALIQPAYAFGAIASEDMMRIALFIINGSIISLVCSRYRSTLERSRQMEQQALQSRGLIEAIGQASPALIYAKDREFRTIYANPATLKVLAVSPDDVFGKAATDYASRTDEGEQHAANDARVIESGQVEIANEVFTSPDGTTRTFRSSKAPLRDSAGNIVGIAGVSVDVTEQLLIEQRLRVSEARLRLALEAGRMAVWDHDVATDTLTGTPELNRLFGFAEDEPLDIAKLREGYPAGERERLRAEGAEAMARGERFFESEFRFNRRDGETRWYLLRAEMVPGPDGAIARAMGVVLDITNLKEVQADLSDRQAELDAALDAGNLAVVDYDHVTGLFRPSEQLNALYGYPPDRALTIADVRARYHPENAHLVYEQIQREAADVERTDFRWTLRLQMPDSAERWVDGRGEYIRDEAGRIIRSRGVVMDVTERVQSERHQRLLIAELNHRVKNTLAIIQGVAHQTFKGDLVPKPVRAAFEGRLLALATAHNLLTEVKWEMVDLEGVVGAILRPHAAGDDRLIIAGPAVSIGPKAAVTLAMALHELATNSAKYGSLSAEGGQVEVTWSTPGDPQPSLKLRWEERNGPPVSEPERRGFGSRMIERALAAEFGGRVELRFLPGGVVCEIDAPLPEATA